MKKKICVFTGSRAEYGLLKPLMDSIQKNSALQMNLIVSGTHLSTEFGETYREILADGFTIDQKVEILLSADTAHAVVTSIGLATIKFGDVLDRFRPDTVVILGDRFECLAMAQAALIMRIPVTHIHGGEVTVGAFDDSIRHAITKMASLHFTATEAYRKRVIQLGERPNSVFNVGALGIDNLKTLPQLRRSELSRELGFDLETPFLLVTYHPETLGKAASETSMKGLLSALEKFPNLKILITKSNADPKGRAINEILEAHAKTQKQRVYLATSLGQVKYLSAMRLSEAVVGNSSSGIIEAPAARVPTVNIGDRQKGRIRTPSIVDCGEDEESIVEAIRKVLSEDFKKISREQICPYGDGNAAAQISATLAKTDFTKAKDPKVFFDLPFNESEING